MRVFVINRGSSSLKLSVLDDGDNVLAVSNETLAPGADPAGSLRSFLEGAPTPDVAGVRVVHGGPWFSDCVVIDDRVDARLEQLGELAPLHNPPALAAIAALRKVRPELRVVACFDTGFHVSLPPAAYTYAVPREWDIRRYGFHGLSHAYASRRAASMLGRPVDELRLVTCHLGAGASLCAVDRGVSVDTTMGYTPLEGLVMATRSGTVDPGGLLAVQRRLGLSAPDMEAVLNRSSGLQALAGTGDMRELVARAGAGDEVATLGLAVYQHRLRASVAAMAVSMGGLDGVVFTGGIGEGSAVVRRDAASALGWLGLAVDRDANEVGEGDRDISTPDATVRTIVVTAREDIEIARGCRRRLGPVW